MSENKKNKGCGGCLFKIILLIVFIVFAYNAGKIGLEYYGSYKDKSELNNLKNSVVIKNNNNKKNIDFAKLKEKNSDTIGWLEIPGTDFEEPIVQSKENSYYLHRNFDKKTYPYTGAIFLDSHNNPFFLDRVSYIYGHNIWDKTKFYCLKYFEDPNFMAKNNKINVYTPTKDMQYKVLGVSLVPQTSGVYSTSLNNIKDFEGFKKELAKYLPADKVAQVNLNSKVLILITCKTPDDYSKRRVLISVLEKETLKTK